MCTKWPSPETLSHGCCSKEGLHTFSVVRWSSPIISTLSTYDSLEWCLVTVCHPVPSSWTLPFRAAHCSGEALQGSIRMSMTSFQERTMKKKLSNCLLGIYCPSTGHEFRRCCRSSLWSWNHEETNCQPGSTILWASSRQLNIFFRDIIIIMYDEDSQKADHLSLSLCETRIPHCYLYGIDDLHSSNHCNF